jgi:hypothetical protein
MHFFFVYLHFFTWWWSNEWPKHVVRSNKLNVQKFMCCDCGDLIVSDFRDTAEKINLYLCKPSWHIQSYKWVPLICNNSTALSFMLWLHYVCRHNTQNPMNRRLCGPLSFFGSFGGEKNLTSLQGIEAQTVQSTSYPLYWLRYHSFSVLLYKFLLLMCQHPQVTFCIRSDEKR